MDVSITFLGAVATVTGSKYLVTWNNKKILVDCGMFQGERMWRERNWSSPPFDPSEIDAVLLTHAHVDHVGMLPRYWKLGLRAPVFCSQATAELARLILLDSAKLQEEEASFRQKYGRSRHSPPLPLYTEEDAVGALQLLRPVAVATEVPVFTGASARWELMGHILGACSIQLNIGDKRIVFSGDIGRYGVPILVDPTPVPMGDLLLIESTYGDRRHGFDDPSEPLAEVISKTAARDGVVIIPSFAVGRTQTLLYYLRELKAAKRIPDIPVIIDSPMANDATAVYRRHRDEYDASSAALLEAGTQPFSVPKMYFIQDREESKKLNRIQEAMVLISASGMLSGGRILHHLRHRVANERNTLLFVGFQPPGSRGDWLKRGGDTIRLLGEDVPVRAQIAEISGLSAHADKDELIRWCKSCTGTPSKVAVVHGETSSAESFSASLRQELGWNTVVPNYTQTITV